MHRRTFTVFACALPWLAACQIKPSVDPALLVTGKLKQVLPSAESTFYVTAVLAIQNSFSQSILVRRYRLEWPGGQYLGPSKALKLAAGELRDWRVRLDHSRGDIHALLEHPEMARVVILDIDFDL